MVGFQTDAFIDSVLLLSKCKDEKNIDIVNQLIELYTEEAKLHPENDTKLDRNFIELLTKLKSLSSDPKDNFERNSLLTKFLSNPLLQQDENIKNSLKNAIDAINDDNISEANINKIQKKLSNGILRDRCFKYVKKMYNKLSAAYTTFDEDKADIYFNEAINMSRKIVELTQSSERLAAGAIERIDFNNKESLQKSLSLYKEREITYKLQTGLQGLNLMLGRRKGFALGECVVIYALNHNFKSGMLMTIARGLVKYNTPEMFPTDKGKPLILFITLENEANRNLMWLYQHAYEQTFQKSCEGLSDEEIINFVVDYYGSNGYEFIMERRNGANFTYDNYVELIESYEQSGYWVMAVLMDYVSKMSKAGFGSSSSSIKGNHNLVDDLFANLFTYSKTKGILFITAHQLNRGAQELAASGRNNVVKYFGPQYAADSIGVSREADLEMYLYLEYNQYGTRYLTCMRGKHRYNENTEQKYLYFAYPFTEYGIADDINKEPGFVRDIYAVPNPNGEEDETNNLDNSIF